MTPALLVGAAYLIGGLPTSLIAGRLAKGIDLREHGSGNLGATNVFRVLGWKIATPVMLIDVLKGWLPTYLFTTLDGQPAAEWALAYGAAAIVGHVFSPYIRFRGGKGVATSAGVFLALSPGAALTGMLVWAAVVWRTRIVSLGSLAAAVALPVGVYALEGTGFVLWLSLALALFVIVAHRANIRRLLRGEELRFRRSEEVR